MLIIKSSLLLIVFTLATYIGILISNKFRNRVADLKELRSALNMLQTKIKFTYMPLPDIFKEISEQTNSKVGNIFKVASIKMEFTTAGNAWKQAIDLSDINLNSEDVNTLKGLGKLLGQTDVEGQISEIELVEKFIDVQIQKAENECQKNQKLYKTLGAVIGLGIVIILI